MNAVVAGNGGYGLYNLDATYEPVVTYSDVHDNGSGDYSGLSDPTGSDGNLSVDPEFVSYEGTADPSRWDLHPAPGSPLVDAGDPSITDDDGTTSDIGAYGGPNGDASYSHDADGDGLADGWEDAHGLDTTSDDSGDDPDGDGATNLAEMQGGTDPNTADQPETCDDLDNDGDGAVDEGLSTSMWYTDADSDGYGDPATGVDDCAQPSGTVSDGTDCDDAASSVNPGAFDWTDGIDNDCDTITDQVPVDNADAAFYGEDPGDYAGTAVAGGGDIDGDGVKDLLLGAPDGSCGGVYVIYGPPPAGASMLDDASLSDSVLRVASDTCSDLWGHELASTGDLDGDGLFDILVGHHSRDNLHTNAGAISVMYAADLANTTAEYVRSALIVGDGTSEYLGFRVSTEDDLDGDGDNDIAASAYQAQVGSQTAAGAVYIFDARVTTSSATEASSLALTILEGETGGDLAGSSLAAEDDVNGDGYADVLVGAVSEDSLGTGTGAAYLVLGPLPSGSISLSSADTTWNGEGSENYLGRAVSSAGDLDQDGTEDILLGASSNGEGGTDAGAAYIYLGGSAITGGSVSGADAKWIGPASARAGYSLDDAGDVNCDGYPDALVGGYKADSGSETQVGAVWLLAGGTSFSTGTHDLDSDSALAIYGTATDTLLGEELAGVGDIDGDGCDDIFLGARGYNHEGADQGAGFFFYGGAD